MAMPSAKRLMQMTHQPQQCNWRMNMMGCGGEDDARLCQRLDDVKKLTHQQARGLAPFSLTPVPVRGAAGQAPP